MRTFQSKLVGCVIKMRAAAAGVLFYHSAEHGIQCCLDHYAIIPLEEYTRLRALAGESIEEWRGNQSELKTIATAAAGDLVMTTEGPKIVTQVRDDVTGRTLFTGRYYVVDQLPTR